MKVNRIISFIFLSLLLLITGCTNGNECKHEVTTWIIDKKATCTDEGSKHEECNDCYEKLNEEIINAIGYNYENDECTRCHKKLSIGLEYKLNEDNNSYSVVGIGSCIDADIVIKDIYNELPVTSIGSSTFEDCSSLTIYCETSSKPSNWSSNWNSNCPVIWNHKNLNVQVNS